MLESCGARARTGLAPQKPQSGYFMEQPGAPDPALGIWDNTSLSLCIQHQQRPIPAIHVRRLSIFTTDQLATERINLASKYRRPFRPPDERKFNALE